MASKKENRPALSSENEARVLHLVEQRHEIAQALRQSTSRAQAETALAEVNQCDETTQLAYLKSLTKQHDTDAADVLLAINELSPNKAVRKEAKRALIQLAGAKVYPGWTPEPEAAPVGVGVSEYPPRFWKGYVTQMREEGEVELVLCWEQGFEYGEARMMSFLLDFWQDGVKDFYAETGTKRHIDSHINDLINSFSRNTNGRVKTTDCTLAEGRRLLLEALEVNQWRKTTPHKDYRNHVGQVQQLVLNATDVGEDRGRTFIRPGLEPDEVAANFIGGWSLGDFGLCYDLLTPDSSLLEGQSRDEWVEQRRKWANEAHPARFEPRIIHEREQSQQTLWLPGSIRNAPGTSRREVETCWSLELTDTQLSGTLPEMPMGTAVLKETGRHWFWTSYTLAQIKDEWRITRMTDEGANAQGLPIADLQKRLKEHEDAIQHILKNEDPNGPNAQQHYSELVRRSIQSLHYIDALLVKLPFDNELYEKAVGHANGLAFMERALVYLQKWLAHIPENERAQRAAILQQLGAVYASLASQYEEIGMQERGDQFFSLAEESIEQALQIDNTVLGHILLAELSMMQDKVEQAESELKQAQDLHPEREEEAQIEHDLAQIALERDQLDEAQRHFERVADLNAHYPNLWFNLGHVHRLQNNYAEATLFYQRAIEEDPRNIAAFSELGAIYLSQNNMKEAHEILERGLRINPQSAHLRAMLAGVFLEEGKRRQAEAMLQEAEAINPDLEIVRAVRSALESSKTGRR